MEWRGRWVTRGECIDSIFNTFRHKYEDSGSPGDEVLSCLNIELLNYRSSIMQQQLTQYSVKNDKFEHTN